MGVYDHMMKVLIDHYPKALTQFAWDQWGPQWPDDSPVAMAEINQVTLLNTEFKTTDLEADSVLLVEGSHGLKCMVQLEFQSRPDELMPLRSLEYYLRAKKKYWDVYGDLPVSAAVIYMFDEEHLPVPPMRWSAPDGQTSLWFSYVSISLPAMPREQLLALHRPELWPLVLLTVYWLQEYQKMFELFRDAPAYQWMKRDATEEARREEKARADEEEAANTTKEMILVHQERICAYKEMARVYKEMACTYEEIIRDHEEMVLQRKQELRMQLNELRQTVVVMTAVRFPELTELAQTIVWKLTRPQAFLHLFARLSQARDAAEAQGTLQTLLDEEGEVNAETLDE